MYLNTIASLGLTFLSATAAFPAPEVEYLAPAPNLYSSGSVPEKYFRSPPKIIVENASSDIGRQYPNPKFEEFIESVRAAVIAETTALADIQKDPNNVEAHLNLASALKALGRDHLAMPVYENALRLDSKNVDTYIAFAEFFRR